MTPQDRFDRSARAAHAASLQALSPQVQAQLTQRRRAVLAASDARPRPVRWGWVGAAAAAVCVLVLAVQLRPAVSPVTPAPRVVAAVQTATVDPGAVLAEDPDFYLWLASNESRAYAVE